jgi:hypothetical protein
VGLESRNACDGGLEGNLKNLVCIESSQVGQEVGDLIEVFSGKPGTGAERNFKLRLPHHRY